MTSCKAKQSIPSISAQNKKHLHLSFSPHSPLPFIFLTAFITSCSPHYFPFLYFCSYVLIYPFFFLSSSSTKPLIRGNKNKSAVSKLVSLADQEPSKPDLLPDERNLSGIFASTQLLSGSRN